MKERIAEHLRAAAALEADVPLLEAIVEAIGACFAAGGRLYILGNGGSAADAQHIAAELVGRFKRERRGLPAVALTTDTSVLTAIGNDLGGEEIFARQVQALVRAGDVVWVLSVSGSSPNVLAAVDVARRQGARIIGFTSRRGAVLAGQSDYCLSVDHDSSDRVQEVHALAYHLVCDEVERRFAR